MLTTKCPPSWKAGRLCAYKELLHSTRGGLSDTEVNELAVIPCNLPSRLRVVTMVTPVANEPSALRSSRTLKPSAEVLCTVASWLPGISGISCDTIVPRLLRIGLGVRLRRLQRRVGRQAERDAPVHRAVDVPVEDIMRVGGMDVAKGALQRVS